MAYSQSSRFLSAKTAIGADALLLASFVGEEELSQPFQYQLEFLSEKPSVDVKAIVGKPVSWGVTPVGGTERRDHGIVKSFISAELRLRSLRAYRAEVVPYFWLLTQTTDCRIFQSKTVPDIIKAIFSDNGLTDFQPNLKATYPTLEYCVQYRESDFDFVSRLMEEYGIFYYFLHSADKHTMVLADHKGAYKDGAEKNVDYSAGGASARLVTAWEHRYSFHTGKWAQTDYNFETPSASLMTNADTLSKVPGADKFEQYDFPGRYIKKPDGTPLTKIRMEETEAVFDVVQGRSTCSTFSPAHKFALASHPIEAEKGSYVVTSVQHKCLDESHVAGSAGKQEYTNTFTCIPEAVTFRPPRKTSRAVVTGPQTAVVVGPKGEEIYTDKHGRVKVQFHWDRLGKKDENSSCWIRVSQNWAGKRWGATFVPRIGQEVIVDFLEGDPDRPIITGRVYNAEQMHPYLGNGPDSKHPNNPRLSGIKTNTTPGGVGFNELRFDDTKGKEQVFIHAEKNMDVMINGMKKETIGDTYDLHVKDGMWFKVDDQYHHTAKARFGLTENNDEHHVKGQQVVMVDGKQSLTVSADKHEKVTGGYAMDAATIHLNGGQTVVIEAGTQLTLKVGGNFIDINSGGIFIKGSAVMINSGGAAGSGSGASPETPFEPYPGEDADNAVSGQKSCP